MKILLLINSLGAGGAERSMVELAKFLHERDGITVKFVCLERRTIGLEEEVKIQGIETLYLNKRNATWRIKINFFINIIKKENPDIVHSVLAESNLILRLSRLYSKKGKIVQSLVSTPYSLERKRDRHLLWKKFLLFKQLDKWTARITPGIFYHAISKEVFKHYQPLYKIKKNYRIIYRGRYDMYSTHNLNSGNDFKLINIGRQEFAKGQIIIIRALAYLRDKYGMNQFKLEILGRPGHSTEEINEYIEKHYLQDQVKLSGFVSDAEIRLSKGDAFVFSSYYEGLGGALIEAFAAGLPCLCSDIPVLREVVGKEDGALFSPPGDYKGLADNILKLYQSKELQENLGRFSYSRFREQFQIEKVHGEMLEMYIDVLTDKGPEKAFKNLKKRNK